MTERMTDFDFEAMVENASLNHWLDKAVAEARRARAREVELEHELAEIYRDGATLRAERALAASQEENARLRGALEEIDRHYCGKVRTTDSGKHPLDIARAALETPGGEK